MHGHKKHRFGSRSESSAQLALELILEELQIEQAAEVDDEEISSAAETPKPPRTPRRRKPFPNSLKRVQKTIKRSETCEDCGGSFRELGADLMEELEYVRGHYIINQINRPRLACTCCDKIVQAEMPSRPIPKSFVGPALMAHILCCKYGYHLPLYRQSQMFENEGIDLNGSLMASWVGKCTKLLKRLSDAIRDHVFEAQAIFMDDTSVRLLQKDKARTSPKPQGPGPARLRRRCGISSQPVGARNILPGILNSIRALPMRMPVRVIMTAIARDVARKWPVWCMCAGNL